MYFDNNLLQNIKTECNECHLINFIKNFSSKKFKMQKNQNM